MRKRCGSLARITGVGEKHTVSQSRHAASVGNAADPPTDTMIGNLLPSVYRNAIVQAEHTQTILKSLFGNGAGMRMDATGYFIIKVQMYKNPLTGSV